MAALDLVAVRAHSDPPWLGGNDRIGGKLRAESFKKLDTGRALLARGETDESNNAGVGQATHDGQLAKVLIQGNQHAIFLECLCKDFLITRVTRPASAPDDIVTTCGKFGDRAAPHAAIKQQLQAQAAC